MNDGNIKNDIKNDIRYRYTSLSKQVLIGLIFVFFLMRLIIMLQICIYKLEGYEVNLPLTLLMYAAIFFVCYLLFRGHTFCYSLYDDTGLIYRNAFLRRERALNFSDVRLAVFDTFGVNFYRDAQEADRGEKPVFVLPFFRDGIIQAVQVDGLYKMLKSKEDIEVRKLFKVLPGYTKKWRFVSIAYGFLCVLALTTMVTPLTVIIVLFQNH